MPTAITCPSCKRVLSLPPEAMNRVVQCPACKHQFHPAEALPAEAVRAATPNLNPSVPTESPASTPTAAPSPPAERRAPAPPPPPSSFDIRRSDRRGKRESEDICPNCKAFVKRGVDKCPECGAEFVSEEEDGFRPWEQEGMERRDSEPHRGTLIMFMGIGSIVLACLFWMCYIGIGATLMGGILAAVTVAMARGDVKKMDQHAMNNDGRSTTSGGMICAYVGLVLNLLGLPAAIAMVTMLP
jgi:hypothetical protein